MPNLNKVMLMGNLTRDPEIKYTPKGTAVTEFGLAVNRVFTSEAGERREETTFVDISMWGRQAEIAAEYLKKGRPVYIEGRLKLDTWDDKQTGQKRSKLRVVGETLQFLGGREGGGAAGSGGGDFSGGESEAPAAPPQRSSQRPPPRPSPPPRPPADPDLDTAEEDDIPF